MENLNSFLQLKDMMSACNEYKFKEKSDDFSEHDMLFFGSDIFLYSYMHYYGTHDFRIYFHREGFFQIALYKFSTVRGRIKEPLFGQEVFEELLSVADQDLKWILLSNINLYNSNKSRCI